MNESDKSGAVERSAAMAGGKTNVLAVHALTFINSLGTGVVTNGIFFITKQGYGFSALANFGLGVLLGVTYIFGALAAGPVQRGLRRAFPQLSTRAILCGIMVLLGVMCALPIGAAKMGVTSTWPAWVLVAIYSPLSGMLWPIVESYLSGGRSGQVLRKTIGVWNIVWSSALVVAYWAISPLIKDHAVEAVAALGSTHLLGLVCLIAFAREPAAHVHAEHEPHPVVYEKLLVAFRWLLPMSYVVSSALGPYLPDLMPKLKVPEHLQTITASAWLIPRCLAFAVLGFWPGWHGMWWPAIGGGGALLAGFAVCVASTFAGGAGLAVLLAGLALFGVGMGTIYSGAIYYAMEVGKAQVDAGGTHEALIGAGYTLGPLCGIAAVGIVHARGMREGSVNTLLLVEVAIIAMVMAMVVVRQVRRGGREA
jgi:MFS family permease